ncbi:18114_t:CDS:2, partial [Funneliformis geosporum]
LQLLQIIGIEIEGNIEYDVEDESEIVKSDEHMEISFKLVIRKEGKNCAAKWETIYPTNENMVFVNPPNHFSNNPI